MEKKANVKIAYIGGGSRGWAWMLMKDLANAKHMSGCVDLYDIDFGAAKANEIIGNRVTAENPEAAPWSYRAVPALEEALTGAAFVIISILPGTFREMASDVHTPEKYGIYQPVGDTAGPGGIIRALRTIPMYETIGKAIREHCPDAWVINYTNPMSLCVRTLYEVFPEIKAFGCCHEVFGTQKILCQAVEEMEGIPGLDRKDISVNVLGINHFTWFTEANYRGKDLFPVYREYALRHRRTPAQTAGDDNWLNKAFETHEFVKFDLFLRYGYVAAAGDRHLAEFCPPAWYTASPRQVHEWGYGLTPVSWREERLQKLLQESADYAAGVKKMDLEASGEEGVRQMEAILGFGNIITNVNLPNQGQISNVSDGVVVETNAAFSANSVRPVAAGAIPPAVYGLTAPFIAQQDLVMQAAKNRDLELAFTAFCTDPHVQVLSLADARRLFDEMVENTKEYLKEYF